MTDDNTEQPDVEVEVTSLLVRSTMHLPDIGIGAVVYVDPRVPYIAGCLRRGFLLPVVAEDPSPVEQLEPPDAEAAEAAEAEEQSSAESDPGLEDAAAVVPD